MVTFVVAGFICACTALALALVLKRSTPRLLHIILPPSAPGAWPVLGHLHLLAANREPLQRFLRKLAESYGALFCLQLGSIPVVVISSPQAAKEFLQVHELSFAQRPKNEVGRRVLFDHKTTLTMGCGAEWRSLRKLYVAVALSGKQVAQCEGLRRVEMEERMEEVKRRAEREGELGVELGKEIYITVGNMITRVLFSRRLFSEKTGCVYREVLEDLAKELGLPVMGDLMPSLFWLDHISGRIGRLNALSTEFNSLMHDVLAPRKLPAARSAAPSSPPTAPSPADRPPAAPASDCLDLLLQLYHNDGSAGIESIKGILADFLLGGIDSTATTIKWAMAELLSNPDCMAKLQEEMHTLMGTAQLQRAQCSQSHGSQRPLAAIGDLEVAKMSYLHAVVKETLRLHPPFPLIIRQLCLSCPAQDSVNVGMYKLPNKTTLVYNAWAVARDPEIWGEDAHKFCPDRFLCSSGSAPQAHGQHLEYVPFGTGSRGCPGRALAFTVVPFVVANLVYRFDWALPAPGVTAPLDLSDELPGVPSRLAHPLRALPTLRDLDLL